MPTIKSGITPNTKIVLVLRVCVIITQRRHGQQGGTIRDPSTEINTYYYW